MDALQSVKMQYAAFALWLAAATAVPKTLPVTLPSSVQGGNGFNSLSDTLVSSAQNLYIYAENVGKPLHTRFLLSRS